MYYLSYYMSFYSKITIMIMKKSQSVLFTEEIIRPHLLNILSINSKIFDENNLEDIDLVLMLFLLNGVNK